MRYHLLLVSGIISFLCLPAYCSTIHVPADIATIQRGIKAAKSGDVVSVAPGTYMENVNFLGKAIAVRSEYGPDLTTIDGKKTGSVVTCNSDEGQDSILEGFSITNGSGTRIRGELRGGGMFNEYSSPTIIYCVFHNNTVEEGIGGGVYNHEATLNVNHCTFRENEAGSGGGIYNDHCDPFLTHCAFIGNKAWYGAGLYNERGFAIITNCVFSENDAYGSDGSYNGEGGGMYNSHGAPTISDCQFIKNGARWCGAGMSNFFSSPTVTNCLFQENATTTPPYAVWSLGGGMDNSHGNPVISSCIFFKNRSDQGLGGGMANNSVSATITNCLFIENSAGQGGGGGMYNGYSNNLTLTNCAFIKNTGIPYGGGMDNYDSAPNLTHCTFSGNVADQGGAIYATEGESIKIKSSVLWGNDPDEIVTDGIHNPMVSYSCIQGGFPGEGNFDDDPLLQDLESNNYHLTRHSPCINRGTNVGAPPDDLDGDPRPYMSTVDTGCDEFTGRHTLSADDFALSRSMGGEIPFLLQAETIYAGHFYCLLGTLSGTSPGTPLPGEHATLPLNLDGFTNFVLARLNSPNFSNFLGVFNGEGLGSAILDVLPGAIPSSWEGSLMHFAYTIDTFDLASNPLAVEIVP